MASASPLRTSSDTRPPGAVSPAMARRTGSRIGQVHQHAVAEHGREAGNPGPFGIILDQAALDPHPAADPAGGGQVPLEPGQQVGEASTPVTSYPRRASRRACVP